MKKYMDQIIKWAPVIAIAVFTSVFEEKKKDKEYAELKKKIIKELREEV